VDRQRNFVVVVPDSGEPFLLGFPLELLGGETEQLGYKTSQLTVIVDGRAEGPMLVGTVLRARELSYADQLAVMTLVGSQYGSGPARLA
jgi:hypothetical protein